MTAKLIVPPARLRTLEVIKEGGSEHEDTICGYRIGRHDITLGEPLVSFQGVLRRVPMLLGEGPGIQGDR